jgi:hypothetical protein
LNQNAKLFLSNLSIYNAQIDGDLINVINTTNILNLYNVVGESEGANGNGIISANVVNVRVHGSRFNKPIGPTINDLLTPTGYIFDSFLVTSKF